MIFPPKLVIAGALALTSGIAAAVEPNLFAFVGEKIKVEPAKPSACPPAREAGFETICIPLTIAFDAEYRVLQTVYGQHDGALIRFTAAAHWNLDFDQYDRVLLFLSKTEDGRWVHLRRQYFPIYETASGGWAACGSADQYEPRELRGPDTAQPIVFKRPVIESLAQLPRDKIDERFPATDWKITPDGAVCLRGTPLTELFEAKKQGALHRLGIFP